MTTTPASHHSIFLQAGCSFWCKTNSIQALAYFSGIKPGTFMELFWVRQGPQKPSITETSNNWRKGSLYMLDALPVTQPMSWKQLNGNTLYLCFNNHFPGEPWSAAPRFSSFTHSRSQKTLKVVHFLFQHVDLKQRKLGPDVLPGATHLCTLFNG